MSPPAPRARAWVLPIVRKIMEDHGGEIALGDAENDEQGAEVHLTFPLQQKTVRQKGVRG